MTKEAYKNVKSEIRILGIDDGPFSKRNNKNQKNRNCLAIGTVFRGGNYIDGLISFSVMVDGDDATSKLIKAVKKTKHYEQLSCIMLNGIALAGFNVIDIQKLNKKTSLAVIVIIRRMPDINEIESVLEKLNFKDKIKIIKKAGKIFSVKNKGKKIFIQVAGISAVKAAEIVRKTSTHSLIPEPIRVAHIIASGIVKGESRGRA